MIRRCLWELRSTFSKIFNLYNHIKEEGLTKYKIILPSSAFYFSKLNPTRPFLLSHNEFSLSTYHKAVVLRSKEKSNPWDFTTVIVILRSKKKSNLWFFTNVLLR